MFLLSRMKVGLTAPIVYMTATGGESYTVGEALKLSGGAVTLCSGATAPSHICVGAAGEQGVPCVEVQEYMEFDTTLSASGAALKVGDKVTLYTNGLSVTATTESGVAEITGMEGTAAGDHVTVKF